MYFSRGSDGEQEGPLHQRDSVLFQEPQARNCTMDSAAESPQPGSLNRAARRRHLQGAGRSDSSDAPCASVQPGTSPQPGAESSQSGRSKHQSKSGHANGAARLDASPQSGMFEEFANSMQLSGRLRQGQDRQSDGSAQASGSREYGKSRQEVKALPKPIGIMQQGQTGQSEDAGQPSVSRQSGGPKQRHPQYMAHDQVGQGLKKGVLIRTTIRISAQDRSQAFATVPGLPSDLMLRVCPQLNRTAFNLHVGLS